MAKNSFVAEVTFKDWILRDIKNLLELLDKLQKRICKTIGPSFAATLEPLAHHWNVASLSLFYTYYLGKC